MADFCIKPKICMLDLRCLCGTIIERKRLFFRHLKTRKHKMFMKKLLNEKLIKKMFY